MRKFKITVNGRIYEVEVEEVGTSTVTQGAPAVPAAAAPASAPVDPVNEEKSAAAPKAEGHEEAPVGGERVDSPIPGTILDVKVKEGDSVKRGDVLFILEAMKMENEIMAPHDCKIVKIGVSKGESVDTGKMLAVIA